MRNQEAIVEEIKPIIADVLAVELDEVTPSARFFEDLGGESIDLLDLSFRCEKHFGVQLMLQKVLPVEDLQADADGRLTGESLSRLKSSLPFLDYAEFEANPTRERMSGLLTVQALARFIGDALVQPQPARQP